MRSSRMSIVAAVGLLLVGCAASPVNRAATRPADSARDAIASVIEEDLRDVFLSDPPTDIVESRFYWAALETLYGKPDDGNRAVFGQIIIDPEDFADWEDDFEEIKKPAKLPPAPAGATWWMTPKQAEKATYYHCGVDGAGEGSFIAVTEDQSMIFLYIAQFAGTKKDR